MMTAASPTSLYFWVECADGSLDYVFSNGFIQGSFSPSYTTPADKVAVALYIYATASVLFPPIQVDVDPVKVTPVSTNQVVTAPVYGYSGAECPKKDRTGDPVVSLRFGIY